MIAVLIATFVVTVMTGPAGEEWLHERRVRRDRPLARVMYLPSATCRGPHSE